MATPAFDTLKFARTLREKVNLTPEQAEGMADALIEVLDSDVATKDDIYSIKRDIHEFRGDVEQLKIQTRADIEALRLTTKADIEAVKGEIVNAKSETVRWLVSAVGFQTIAVLGAVIALARILHP